VNALNSGSVSAVRSSSVTCTAPCLQNELVSIAPVDDVLCPVHQTLASVGDTSPECLLYPSTPLNAPFHSQLPSQTEDELLQLLMTQHSDETQFLSQHSADTRFVSLQPGQLPFPPPLPRGELTREHLPHTRTDKLDLALIRPDLSRKHRGN